MTAAPCIRRNFRGKSALDRARGPRDGRAYGGLMDLQFAERPLHRGGFSIDRSVLEKLEARLGRLHARQRLGIEDEREGRLFGQGLNFFHPENWYLSAALIRTALERALLARPQKRREC